MFQQKATCWKPFKISTHQFEWIGHCREFAPLYQRHPREFHWSFCQNFINISCFFFVRTSPELEWPFVERSRRSTRASEWGLTRWKRCRQKRELANDELVLWCSTRSAISKCHFNLVHALNRSRLSDNWIESRPALLPYCLTGLLSPSHSRSNTHYSNAQNLRIAESWQDILCPAKIWQRINADGWTATSKNRKLEWSIKNALLQGVKRKQPDESGTVEKRRTLVRIPWRQRLG